MGVDPNWALLGQAPNIGQSFQQGMAMGRQQAIQARSDNALAAIQKNPDDQNALGTLAIYNPQAANAVIQMKGVQRQEAQRAALAGAYDSKTGQLDYSAAAAKLAASGDHAGAAELAQKGQAATLGRIKFAQAVTEGVAQDAADVHDEASYQQFLARTAPRWKAATLPVPDWLPQHYSEEGVQQIRLHAVSVAEQLKQQQTGIEQHGSFLFRKGETKPFAKLPPNSPYMPVAGMGVLPNPAAVDARTGQMYGITYLDGDNAGATPPATLGAPLAPDAQPATPPMTGNARGVRNNNPLNLTLSPWTQHQQGYAGTDPGGRYAKFSTPEQGMAAAVNLLHNYQARGLNTPAEIVGRWAPAKENGASTKNYVNYVASRLGIGPNDAVPPERLPKLAWAMYEFENGLRPGAHIPREVGPSDYAASTPAPAPAPAAPAAPTVRATAVKDGKTYVQDGDGTWHDTSDEGGDE